MAQIIKHRRGSLESLSAVTSSLQKGEIVIASGSSNLSVTNGASIVFAVPENGQVQAVNRFLIGSSAPATFAAGTYNGMVNGVPFYDSGSGTLYLLGSGGNTAINLVGNIQPFSSSVATSINALSASIGSGTIGTSVAALNTFSASTEISLDNLESFSGSQLTQNSALATITGSLISSASAAKTTNDSQDVSITNLNTFSASVNTSVSNLNSTTASLNTSVSNINSTTASLNTSVASLNSWSASAKTNLTALNATGSDHQTRITDLETFQSDIETAITVNGSDVTINGNFTVSGTQTIVDSTTVQIGDNIIELNGSGAANGGMYVKDVTAPNTNTGSIVWDSTNDYWKAGVKGSEIKVLLAGGDSVVSGSSQITLQSTTGFSSFDSALATITGSLIASASAAKSTNDSQGVSITNLNSTSASVNISIEALNAYTSSNTSTNALNAYTASAETRFTEIGVVSGSLIASASAAKTTNDAQAVSITNINATTASLNTSVSNLNSFSSSTLVKLSNLESTTASLNTSVTNLNSFSSSQLTKDSTLATYTASVETRLTEIGVVSGSLIASASAAKTKNDSQDVSISNLNTTTASLNTSVSNINAFTASADSRLDTLEGTGTIQGLGTGNNVTFAKVTTTGDVIVGGDLVVQGNTTTLNTAQLVIEDKIITLASGSTSNATADGAGLEIAGTSAKFTYNGITNEFSSSVAVAANVTGSVNVPGFGSSKRMAFRNASGNLDFVTAPTTAGDIVQWDGTDFVMSNVIDGGSF